MILNIKYFGLLTEMTGRSKESLLFSGGSIGDLISVLEENYPMLSDQDFQIAQNNTIVNKHEVVTGEEIALLPPFSGG